MANRGVKGPACATSPPARTLEPRGINPRSRRQKHLPLRPRLPHLPLPRLPDPCTGPATFGGRSGSFRSATRRTDKVGYSLIRRAGRKSLDQYRGGGIRSRGRHRTCGRKVVSCAAAVRSSFRTGRAAVAAKQSNRGVGSRRHRQWRSRFRTLRYDRSRLSS